MARPRVDDGSGSGQGCLQREALWAHDRRLPAARRHDQQDRPDLSGRHPAAKRAQFCRGGRTRPLRQARHPPAAQRLGLSANPRERLAAGTADAVAGRLRLEPLARARAVAALQREIRGWRLAGHLRLRLRLQTARLGRPHRRPLPVGQRSRQHDAHLLRADRRGDRVPLRQRRRTVLRLPRHPVRRPRSELEHQARHLPGEVHRQDGLGRDG